MQFKLLFLELAKSAFVAQGYWQSRMCSANVIMAYEIKEH